MTTAIVHGDRFDGPAKHQSRMGGVQVAMASPHLFDFEARKLLGDWAELSGESGPLMVSLLETDGLIGDRRYIGVDIHAERMERFRRTIPRHCWHTGRIEEIVSELEQYEIGILNLDGYYEVGKTHAWDVLAALRPVIDRGIKRFGSFVLLQNNTLDSVRYRGKIKPGDALRAQVENVEAVLRGYAPDRLLTADMLLPKGAEKLINSYRFCGTVGAFEIYKGRRFRMANMRVVL